jgi:hypothetical protein
MTQVWIEALRVLDRNVDKFVDAIGDATADKYQFKWDVLRSVASRSIKGRLTYLPTRSSVDVSIRLPV